METRLKQRMIGAIVLTALAIIILPMLLDGSAKDRARVIARIPEPPGIQLEKLTVGDIDLRMKEMEAASAARVPHLTETRSSAADESPSGVAGASAASEADNGLSLDKNNLPVSWSLQVGSFSDHQNALKLRQALRAASFRTYIIAAQTGQGSVYRVLVGPMLEKMKLNEIAKQIEKRFDLKGQIVRYRIEDDAGQLGG